MSFSWKKQSRISRFMSEFQQSSKRCRSLVAETGFPISLIDIFIKNRDRLKKSSSKRLRRQTLTASNAFSPTKPDLNLKNPAKKETVQNKIEKVNFAAAENKNAIDKTQRVCGGGNGEYVLMAFQVFTVAVVLALSTKKKLTIGITLSSFALLLAELVAARLFTRFKTFTNKDAISREKIETFDDSKEYPDSFLKETESFDLTEKPNSIDSTIRDLLLKDEKKSKSKTSRLKSKIVKKLRSYKKKKKIETIISKDVSLTKVSSLVVTEREEHKSNPTLMRSKEVKNTNGIVVVMVIVLTGLLSGKILAIFLTLSCLFLRFGVAKKI
ncbi:unnamed protein product [Cochlearia groenlandica]